MKSILRTSTIYKGVIMGVLFITLLAANIAYAAAPVAIDQNLGVLRRGQAVTVTLSYTDPDGVAPYTFEITRNPTKGTVVPVGVGQYRYTASQTQSGRDTFQWRVKDAGGQWSNRAVVSIEINEPPVAISQTEIINQDTVKNIWVQIEEDFYPQAADTSIVKQAEHGTVVKLERKKFVYTPTPGYFGPDSFQWKANDGLADGNTATVSITVNQKPIAREQTVPTQKGVPVEFTLDYTDDGVPGPHKVTITVPVDDGTLEELGLARYRYTPDADFDGNDQMWWKISDGMATSSLVRTRFSVSGFAAMSLSPQRLNFYRHVGDPNVSAVVTITNNGGSPMNWSLNPGKSQVFRRTPEQGGFLNPGESADVTLTAPISQVKKGVYTGALQFSSPEAINSPQSVTALLRVNEDDKVRLGISSPRQDAKEREGIWLRDLGVELVRIPVAWDRSERVEGVIDWKELKSSVEWAYDEDFSILLLVSTDCPDWVSGLRENSDTCAPDDIGVWRRYITALVAELEVLSQKYPNGLPIHHITVGNEWHRSHPDAKKFTEQLNFVFDEVKKVFPEMLVSPGGIGSSAIEDFVHGWYSNKRFYIEYVLKNGKYDSVNQHLYFDDLDWPEKIDALRNIALPPAKKDIPVVVGEFGGPSAFDEPRDDAYHAKKVADYIAALRRTDVAEAYHFKLVEPPEYKAPGVPSEYAESGLVTDETLEPKPGYDVFKDHSFQVALQLQDPEDKANEGLFGNVWAFFLDSNLVASLGDLLYNLFPSMFQKN